MDQLVKLMAKIQSNDNKNLDDIFDNPEFRKMLNGKNSNNIKRRV